MHWAIVLHPDSIAVLILFPSPDGLSDRVQHLIDVSFGREPAPIDPFTIYTFWSRKVEYLQMESVMRVYSATS